MIIIIIGALGLSTSIGKECSLDIRRHQDPSDAEDFSTWNDTSIAKSALYHHKVTLALRQMKCVYRVQGGIIYADKL